MGRYFVFFLLFLFHYYSVVFVLGGRQTRVSRPPIGWWGPCVVLRCWENPTHIAKPVSLSLSSFYLFFLFLIFRYTTTHTPPIIFSLFFFFSFPFSMCVLAGWLPCISYSCATTGERKTPDCDGCASLVRRHWHWKEPGWAKLMTNEPRLRWFLFHFSPCLSFLAAVNLNQLFSILLFKKFLLLLFRVVSSYFLKGGILYFLHSEFFFFIYLSLCRFSFFLLQGIVNVPV
jgi:hypothetical protein